MLHAYPEGEVLRGEDTAETLFIVHDEDAIGPLGGAQLTCVGYAHTLGDCQRWAWSQAGDCALDCLLG